MTWIKTIPPENAGNTLKHLYDRATGPDGEIDDIMKAHSLRPHMLESHLSLAGNILNNNANALARWKLLIVGVYVSYLNGCEYCADSYSRQLQPLMDAHTDLERLHTALKADQPEQAFAGVDLAIMLYANLLTTRPDRISLRMIEELRHAGLEDGEILEINQAVAYFSYVNRTVLGLGIQ
jgi:uncharacterized peroxidase-related enzyme|tara:strand:+ start:7453 stop:7992 length:540 start_codon:yes stop_codon:yes gene_type:complete